MSPEEYLKSLGISLNTMGVFDVIEGKLRQVDIQKIMSDYASIIKNQQCSGTATITKDTREFYSDF